MTRPLWMAAGIIFVVLGWVGMVLPVMPGFVFLIGAAYCFGKGNPRWEAWLLSHPTYGPPLRDWQEHRRISRRSKYSAIGFMAVAGAITFYFAGMPIALIPIGIMTLVAIWIWTRSE